MQFNSPPLFERRGLMLDISRNRVPTMDCLKQLIDALAALHYNELQLYTEHTFAYSGHETVWGNASPMTADEIRAIDAYCKERRIELVPNQNSFGHMERWLQHPPYRHLAESPDGFIHPISGEKKHPSTLHPCPESLGFIDQLYSELLPNFKSSLVHVGGDEPWELGKGRSKDLADKVGKHRVYLDYMKGVFEVAEKYGRTPQFWADIIMERPDLVPELPDNVVPVIWGYEADSPFAEQCKIVAEAGFRNHFYVGPGAGNWNSFSGRLDVARANIELAAKKGLANQARGMLLTAWGDNGHHQSWPSLYPPLVLAAASAHGVNLSDGELAEAIDRIFYADSPSGHGKLLCQIGKIDAMLPQPAPPNSFLHSAFFADSKVLPELLRNTTEAQLQACLNALDQLELEGLAPELQLSADLNRSALERCLNMEPSKTRDELADEFAKQWRRRSREGGLSDSLALMRA